MAVEVIVDGHVVELPPRRAEILRQLMRADLELDTMEVGAIEFRVAQEKVSLRVTRSYPAVRVLQWLEWVRGAVAKRG